MQDKSSISGARPLRSRASTDGLDRAPHRAFLRAMGLNARPLPDLGSAVSGWHSGEIRCGGRTSSPGRCHP